MQLTGILGVQVQEKGNAWKAVATAPPQAGFDADNMYLDRVGRESSSALLNFKNSTRYGWSWSIG